MQEKINPEIEQLSMRIGFLKSCLPSMSDIERKEAREEMMQISAKLKRIRQNKPKVTY